MNELPRNYFFKNMKRKKLNSYRGVERRKMTKLYFDGFNILKLTTSELN